MELTRQGIECVVLEAGPYLKNEDYENDEWKAFHQMAWLDPRTTSGSWRIAKDFPSLPAWIVKAVGGTTTHWSGATPRFKPHEFKALSTYGKVEGASLLDWPITLEDLEPYYKRAEDAMGSTHRGGRAALPANNNYKVFANGAERVGYKRYATGLTPPTPNPMTAARRPFRTVSTSRATSRARNGPSWSGKSRGRWRPACSTCGPTAM